MTNIQISTKDYLLRKSALEENIVWYEKTINEVAAHQTARRNVYQKLRQELFELERDYRNG